MDLVWAGALAASCGTLQFGDVFLDGSLEQQLPAVDAFVFAFVIYIYGECVVYELSWPALQGFGESDETEQ